MARKTIDKLKEAFIKSIYSYDECLIDSLLRVNEKDVSLCNKHCYYCNWSIGENTICKNTLGRKLREVL